MKSLRMTAFGWFESAETELPELNDGEALIRIRYVGICGSDVHIFEGNHPTAKPPMILGHEFCGELVELKSNANGFKNGDLVTGHPLTSCGHCRHCMNGRENLCSELSIFGVHGDGCYAEYIKVAADRLVKFNPDIDAEIAALAEPLGVALHDIRRSGLRAGESVFIIGAGTIGLLLAIVAEMNGAGKIVLSEIAPERIKMAEEMGFSVINPASEVFETQFESFSADNGFDRVFEVSGTQSGCNLMTKVAASGGTVVLIGIPNVRYEVDIVSNVLRELDFKGVRIHTFNNFRDAVEIINSRKINNKLERLISRVYPAEDAAVAFADIHNDKTIVKALLKFS